MVAASYKDPVVRLAIMTGHSPLALFRLGVGMGHQSTVEHDAWYQTGEVSDEMQNWLSAEIEHIENNLRIRQQLECVG